MLNLGMVTLTQRIAVEKHVGITYVCIGGLVVTGSLS